jgi:cytochrome P450
VSSGRCEFIGDFASPFAMLVIADLLGVPEEEHGDFEEAKALFSAAGDMPRKVRFHDFVLSYSGE